MSDRRHDWEFEGELIDIAAKQLSSGKTLCTLVLSAKRGEYEHRCVCDYWQDLPDGLEVGATVHAAGRMNGREWQGKHYAGLTAVALEVESAGDGADEPTDGPPVEDTGDYSGDDSDSVPF